MKNKNLFITTLVFVMLVFMIMSCKETQPQNDWAVYRGPNGNGIISEINWNPQKLDSTAILWRKDVGQGHGAIAIKDNYCYVSGWGVRINGTDTTSETTIYCFDVNTGDEIWKFKYQASWINFPGPRATPVVDNNKLYHLGWEGDLYCLNAENGSEIWHRDIYADSLGYRRGGSEGYCSSPVICEDKLLLCLGKNGLALDKNSGKTIWKSDKNGSTESSPVLYEKDSKMVAIMTCDSSISGVSVNDGKVLWSYMKVTGDRGLEPIILPDNKIFLGSECVKFESSNPSLMWKNDTVASFFQTGVVLNGYAYQFGWGKNINKMGLHCVELSTGNLMWYEKMERWGSLIAVDDKLIILKGEGKLAIAKAQPEKYEELASYQALPDTLRNKQFIACWTNPAMANGKILIRNFGGDVACLDLKN